VLKTMLRSRSRYEPNHFDGAGVVTRSGSGSNYGCNINSLLKMSQKKQFHASSIHTGTGTGIYTFSITENHRNKYIFALILMFTFVLLKKVGLRQSRVGTGATLKFLTGAGSASK
jgi:hypothetical protein